MNKLDKNFVFVHVPKAGGTSVTELLFDLLKPVYPREQLFGYPLYTKIAAPAEPSLFISHFGYSFYRGAGGYCMTVMRDPVERILSLFSYWKNPGGKMPPGDPLPDGMTLEEFLESERPDIWTNVRNAQTWQIAFGLDRKTRERLSGIHDFELLDIAKKNLDSMDVVGVIEKQSEFISQLWRLFPTTTELKLLQYNASVERTLQTALEDSTVTRIRELTALDGELYRHAYVLSERRADMT